MSSLLAHLLSLLALATLGWASPNGGYYSCDFTSSSDLCIFSLSSSAPDDWKALGAVEHGTTVSPCKDGNCQVQDLNGDALTLSPKPWKNGDNIVATTTTNTGDTRTYSLIFELVAPLRNLMMYHPGEINANNWKLFTKAFVDCKVKDENEDGDNGEAYSVDNIYEIVNNVGGNDMVHHYVLQFLEEGAIDLVCLATDLEMERCDTIRSKWELEDGAKCDCWMDAYRALYEADPDVDTAFTECAN